MLSCPRHLECPHGSGLRTWRASPALGVRIPGGQMSTLGPESQNPEVEEWVTPGAACLPEGEEWPHLIFLELA